MCKLLVGNAPCSWGTLEFEAANSAGIGYSRMLDELVEAGYTGCELGDWGYMPTDASALGGELQRRNLVMLGAFVPVALKDERAHEPGIAAALKIAQLLAAVASTPKPYLVLADANGTDPERTHLAGKIPHGAGLSPAAWKIFAAGADRISTAVAEETGLRTVFHHHCAGYVETPEEIDHFLDLTDARKIGLVFDTGHFTYGAGHARVVEALDRYADRVWYVHFKDCDLRVVAQARRQEWDYFTALRYGVFCELGNGAVDFPAVLRWLATHAYSGYVLVEQDVLPGMGAPRESARRNREYLKSIESNFN